MNRVRHVETLEMANSKQSAEIIVVLKKLAKNVLHSSSSTDDDEVKSYIPNRTLAALDAFDHKCTSDKLFKSKVVCLVYQCLFNLT